MNDNRILCSLSLVFCIALCSTHSTNAEDWPAFRGPQGNGISHGTGVPTEWSRSKPNRDGVADSTNIKWRIPLPGPGNGSPIVVGDKVFLLCAEDSGQKRSTYCFHRGDGSLLWQQSVGFDKVEETHQTNPYCPSTPACDGERLYVWHRSAGMHCYDLDGNPVWSRDLGEFRHIWGGGSSPLIYEDLVIQLCGPGERTFLIAFDKRTGETRWETPIESGGSPSDKGRYVGSWATPVIATVAGQDQIICPYHTRVVSYHPKTGEEMSFVEGLHRSKSDLCYTSPMVFADVAVVLGGFQGPGFAYRLGGEGNRTESHRLWHTGEKSNPQRIGSGVIVDGFLYMANADNPGSIECLNITTGEQQWNLPRSQDGPHWASVILVDGNLFATGQRGTTTVFKPNREKLEVVSINQLNEQCNATPAVSNGELFIRTWEALYCIAK